MNFARGYHIEIGGGRGMPGAGIFGGSHNLLGGGYGKDFKRDLRKIYGASVHFAGRGEMIPNDDSYCDIDPNVVDQWGQAWDCKNLFITDAAPFASNADKNPTLSITALGWRTSDYIADQIKKRNL